MDWITEQIAIGPKEDAIDRELLREQRVRSVLNLIGPQGDDGPRELGLDAIVVIPLLDGHGNDPAVFRQAVESLATLVESHPPVLVHCNLGQNRSAAVVASYLMRSRGLNPEQALSLLAEKRPVVSVLPPLEYLVQSMREGFTPPRTVEVRLASQRLIAFEGPTPIFSFPCVTGDNAHPTPVGQWQILHKRRFAICPRSRASLGYALIFVPSGEAIYQAPPGQMLPTAKVTNQDGARPPGGVQLAEKDAAALFDWAPVGTHVWVH